MDATDEARQQVRAIRQTRCPSCGASFGAACQLSPDGPGLVVVLNACDEHGLLPVHDARVLAAGIDMPPAGWSPSAFR